MDDVSRRGCPAQQRDRTAGPIDRRVPDHRRIVRRQHAFHAGTRSARDTPVNEHEADRKQAKPDAELAHWRQVVERLPLTLQPSLQEQLSRWDILFPFEQRQVETFLRGADSFTPVELDSATATLRTVEARMGVAHWNFSRTVNSMENSAQLARSEYYAEWRLAVNDLFAKIDARARPSAVA